MKRCLWMISGSFLLVLVAAVCLVFGPLLAEVESAKSTPTVETAPAAHNPAVEPQVVKDPVVGFCGNTFATVIIDDRVYSITGGDAVELTALAVNAAYEPDALCDCLAPVRVLTEMDTDPYELNLNSAYIRCSRGQATLTAEQVALVEGILSRLGDEDRIQ